MMTRTGQLEEGNREGTIVAGQIRLDIGEITGARKPA
jgi:hypothetical protein